MPKGPLKYLLHRVYKIGAIVSDSFEINFKTQLFNDYGITLLGIIYWHVMTRLSFAINIMKIIDSKLSIQNNIHHNLVLLQHQ